MHVLSAFFKSTQINLKVKKIYVIISKEYFAHIKLISYGGTR